MFNFIKFLFAGIFLPTMIGLGAIEILARQHPNSYKYKNDYIVQHGHDITTLILGSSRPYYAVNPNFMGKGTFNLANVYQLPYIDCWQLHHYYNKMPNLRTLIVEVNHSTVACTSDFATTRDWHRLTFYTIYMGYPSKFLSRYQFEVSRFDVARMKAKDYCADVLAGKTHCPCDETGWGNDYNTPKIYDELKMNKEAKDWAGMSHFKKPVSEELYRETFKWYEDMASFCAKHDIRLIFVAAPVVRALYDNMDPRRNELVCQLFDELSSKYGIEYKNYVNDSRFHNFDFYDSGHLSSQGAEKFTKIICNDFQLPTSE